MTGVPRSARARRRPGLGRGAAIGLAVLVVIAGTALLAGRGGGAADDGATPFVGGDLHTVAAVGEALYVGGHTAVAVSTDGGRTWRDVPSLAGADAMGWAVADGAVLVGGHPGLFRSADGGDTFEAVTGPSAVPDVHAIDAAGSTVYAASPQTGVLVSSDAGRTWQVRSAGAGRSFMGTILVDPENPDHLVAPDMAGGLATSADGGVTWEPLGGPMGAMAAAWKPTDPTEIIAVGMGDASRTTDAGATWQPLDLPTGTSAVGFSDDGTTVYAGALDGERVRVYRSVDGGQTWSATG